MRKRSNTEDGKREEGKELEGIEKKRKREKETERGAMCTHV